MEEKVTSSEDPHLSPLRLGVSGSSFFHAMPPDLLKIAAAGGKYNTEENRRMADFMRLMMEALKGSEVRSLECYHMLAWEPKPIVEAILGSLDKGSDLEIWSVHAPYGALVEPSLPDTEIRKAAVDACAIMIEMMKSLGARVMVTHPGANVSAPVDRCERLKLSAQTLTEIADMADAEGIAVAVEPMPKREVGNTIEELIWIIENINRPNVGACLDTNHLFPASGLPGAIKKLEDRLISVHISDHDGGGERHWLPFEGVINWTSVIKGLQEICYSGPLIHEVHGSCFGTCRETVEAIENSYARIREIIQNTGIKA